MSFSISGKTAIVTGAANGVGLAIGRQFLEQGANVVFADMNDEQLVHEIGDDVGDDTKARMFSGDLREKLTQANLLSAAACAVAMTSILRSTLLARAVLTKLTIWLTSYFSRWGETNRPRRSAL